MERDQRRQLRAGAEREREWERERASERDWAPVSDAQDEGSLICGDKRHGEGL